MAAPGVWPGPIVANWGVLTGDDARRAIDVGAAGVVVSNHGGRQLDGVSATLRALPEIVRAVNGQVEVLMDGGVRRGGDIVKAICLGARAVLVGRAYAYGLAAAGSTRRAPSHRHSASGPGAHHEAAGVRVNQRISTRRSSTYCRAIGPTRIGSSQKWVGGRESKLLGWQKKS